MPTQDELDADDALRAVFLSALYDVAEERGRQEQDVVNDILPRMKLGDPGPAGRSPVRRQRH